METKLGLCLLLLWKSNISVEKINQPKQFPAPEEQHIKLERLAELLGLNSSIEGRGFKEALLNLKSEPIEV